MALITNTMTSCNKRNRKINRNIRMRMTLTLIRIPTEEIIVIRPNMTTTPMRERRRRSSSNSVTSATNNGAMTTMTKMNTKTSWINCLVFNEIKFTQQGYSNLLYWQRPRRKKEYLKKTIYCVCKNRKLVCDYLDLSRFSNLRFHRFLNGEFIILYLFLVLTSSFINNNLANKNRDRLSVQMCPSVFDFTFSFLPIITFPFVMYNHVYWHCVTSVPPIAFIDSVLYFFSLPFSLCVSLVYMNFYCKCVYGAWI